MSDDELITKYKENTLSTLNDEKVKKGIESILEIDKIKDITEIMSYFLKKRSVNNEK